MTVKTLQRSKRMNSEYKKIPKVIERYTKDCESVAVHECFCQKGRIEHHRIPGFDDEWFEIHCPECKKKYQPYIDQSGDQWIVYKS